MDRVSITPHVMKQASWVTMHGLFKADKMCLHEHLNGNPMACCTHVFEGPGVASKFLVRDNIVVQLSVVVHGNCITLVSGKGGQYTGNPVLKESVRTGVILALSHVPISLQFLQCYLTGVATTL